MVTMHIARMSVTINTNLASVASDETARDTHKIMFNTCRHQVFWPLYSARHHQLMTHSWYLHQMSVHAMMTDKELSSFSHDMVRRYGWINHSETLSQLYALYSARWWMGKKIVCKISPCCPDFVHLKNGHTLYISVIKVHMFPCTWLQVLQMQPQQSKSY